MPGIQLQQVLAINWQPVIRQVCPTDSLITSPFVYKFHAYGLSSVCLLSYNTFWHAGCLRMQMLQGIITNQIKISHLSVNSYFKIQRRYSRFMPTLQQTIRWKYSFKRVVACTVSSMRNLSNFKLLYPSHSTINNVYMHIYIYIYSYAFLQ